MTTTLFDHSAELDQPDDFFNPLEDMMRYVDIVRLILWLWRYLLHLLAILKGKQKKAAEHSNIHSISRDEFGYIDMNGAY